MLLTRWGSGDDNLLIAKIFLNGTTNNLLVAIGADSSTVTVDVHNKLFKLGKEAVTKIFQGVDEGEW